MTNRSTLYALPNLLTYMRIVLIPVICLLLVTGDMWFRVIALVLYAVAAFTDWLDGYLARRSGLTSRLGQMLDPIADKLLVGALIVLFAWDGSFSALDLIPALAILLREIFVSGLREFVGGSAIVIKVSQLAKWKTTVQMVALGFVFAQSLIAGSGIVSDLLLWLAGILSLITGAQYLMAAWPHLVTEK